MTMVLTTPWLRLARREGRLETLATVDFGRKSFR
jgi:hypothetical protein